MGWGLRITSEGSSGVCGGRGVWTQTYLWRLQWCVWGEGGVKALGAPVVCVVVSVGGDGGGW